MKQYPIHRVDRYRALALHDLEVGHQFSLGPNSIPTEILESYKTYRGEPCYVVVQTGTDQAGNPFYTAYTNNDDLEKELTERMMETYRQIQIEANRSQESERSNPSLAYYDQAHQPPTVCDALAIKHHQSFSNNDMFHSFTISDDCNFKVHSQNDMKNQYKNCTIEQIQPGDQILIFGTTRDIGSDKDRFEWRGIEVGELEIFEGALMITGFEYHHDPNGDIQYDGPCMATNQDFEHNLNVINSIGFDKALDMLQSGTSLDSVELDDQAIEFVDRDH